MRWRILRRRRRPRSSSVTKHYLAHKEEARAIILERLAYFNQFYNLAWNRVAIRNQRRCWGSCSSKRNLNFNYKLLFLPPHLRDYIVVHELCHLVHMHHGKDFWALVAQVMPHYRQYVHELRAIDALGQSIPVLTAVQARYQSYATVPNSLPSDAETTTQPSPQSCVCSAA